MSFHDPTSELSLINARAHLEPCAVSPQTEEVLRFALELSQATEGLFDVTVGAELVRRGALPNHGRRASETGDWTDIDLHNGRVSFMRPLRLDFGGIAKGYAVDRAINAASGASGEPIKIVVNAGGDLRMTHWAGKNVRLRHPTKRSPDSFQVIMMSAAALATSASTFLQNGPVILAPDGGKRADVARSASVFAPTCMVADALTKVVSLDPDHADGILKRYDASSFVIEAPRTKTPTLFG
jgi:thiamine biosynthesis lipoprotein